MQLTEKQQKWNEFKKTHPHGIITSTVSSGIYRLKQNTPIRKREMESLAPGTYKHPFMNRQQRRAK